MADYSFLDQIKQRLDAEREMDWSVTPEEAERLMARYPKDTPEAYRRFTPEEFFDGSL